ncbi:hypothetical protein NEMIN01_1316 [Nematocida minor]|uniref:uncharacterized protein n=1 Tax=Nematocida minor TaxID=1912983 RepID=UPI00221FC5B7|nr:uncharacterized protein NEMIN01_1316 [Nematocida minor]KAI5190983.1 hypothetical protein NEMIN01_1316 [Nematocida minor]
MHFCITGGSKGLGRALAIYILLNNHRVTIIDRVSSDLDCDFIKHDFAENLPFSISCDVLVVCHATFDGFRPFGSYSQGYISRYLQINLLSQIDLIKNSKYKKVVYINSVLSIAPLPNISLYSACKGFMHNFLESVRRENTPVLTVYPYKIDTDLFECVKSPYVLEKKIISREIFNSIIKGDTHLYLPSIFKYAYIYALFPLFIQNYIVRFINYTMIN